MYLNHSQIYIYAYVTDSKSYIFLPDGLQDLTGPVDGFVSPSNVLLKAVYSATHGPYSDIVGIYIYDYIRFPPTPKCSPSMTRMCFFLYPCAGCVCVVFKDCKECV